MIKKLLGICLALGLFCHTTLASSAVTIIYDGKTSTVSSISKNNTTYLGVRELGEATGLEVEYDPRNTEVTIHKDDKRLEMITKTAVFHLFDDGEHIAEGDFNGVIQNGKTYVPLRFIFEKFDIPVNYNKGVITIGKDATTTPNDTTQPKDVLSTLSKGQVMAICELLSPVTRGQSPLDTTNPNNYDLLNIAYMNYIHNGAPLLPANYTREAKYVKDFHHFYLPVSTVNDYIHALTGVTPKAPETIVKNTDFGTLYYYREGNDYLFPSWEAGAPLNTVGIDLTKVYAAENNRYIVEFKEVYTYTHDRPHDFPTSVNYNDWQQSYIDREWNDDEILRSHAVIEKKVIKGKEVWHVVYYQRDTDALTPLTIKKYQERY